MKFTKAEILKIFIITAVLAVVGFGFFSLGSHSVGLTLLEKQLEKQEKESSYLKEYVEALESQLYETNTSLKGDLAKESEARLALESLRLSEAKTTDSKLANLANDIELAKDPDVNNIISEWRTRVGKVKCSFDSGTQNGSALITDTTKLLGVRTGAVTNKHVVLKNGTQPSSCSVRMPGLDGLDTYQGKKVSVPEKEYDLAIMELESTTPVETVSICKTRASLGDEILIMGYPSIGATDDVTVTEGIISGFDGDYYITSAKVERGNSGGVAVHLKNNCYLGIPTFAYHGVLESLARILDSRVIGL